MTDLRKAAEMALEALSFFGNNATNPAEEFITSKAIVALRQALAQPEQRENRMTDREAIQKALDTPHRRYSIKPHGNGYAIYRDRDLFHHGFNLGYLTEVTPETIELIENALNTTLAQPEQEPVTWRNAAIRLGEDLYSVGPDGYYDMTAEQWLDWALSVVTAPPSKPWVWLTDEAIDGFRSGYQSGRIGTFVELARAIEAKLKEKNHD